MRTSTFLHNSSDVSAEYGSLRSSLATISLDTVEGVMDGAVDDLEKTWDDQSPALKVSWMLKRKNSFRNQEPLSERSSPYCTVFGYSF